MRTLSRYFALRYLGLFALILVVSVITIVITEMLLNLDDMLSAGDGASAPFVYLVLRIPSYYLRELIPIASFAAAFFALAIGSHWLEVSAAKAGGISPDRLVFPILVAAVLLAGLTFLLGETWIVGSTRAWNRFESGDGPRVSYREGSFWVQHGRTIYSITDADASHRTLRGVRIFDLDEDGRLLRSIDAPRIDVDEDHRWHVDRAVARHYEPSRRDAGARVEALRDLTIDIDDPGDTALIDSDLHSLSLTALRSHATLRRAEGESAHRVEAVLYARLVEPISVVLFALLAAPFGLRVGGGRGFGFQALLGLASVATYFALRSVAMTLSNEGVLSAAAASTTLVVAFALVGLLQLRSIER